MKRKSSIMSRSTAVLLAVVLTMGLVPALSDIGEVRAETDQEQVASTVAANVGDSTDLTPSITAYATKNDLMNNLYDESSDVAGKLTFGYDRVWYILGKDDGVVKNDSGEAVSDNIVLFSTTYLIQQNWSMINRLLPTIGTMEAYFSTAEQELMLETTVKYTDTTSSDVEYKGRLYALDAEKVGDDYLTAGSNNTIKVPSAKYWKNATQFLLRSWDPDNNMALCATADGKVGNYLEIPYSLAPEVRGALAIDLTDVSFASAAIGREYTDAVGAKITAGTAMTLRLNGNADTVGNVYLSEDAGETKIYAKSSVTLASLIVQGKDSTVGDWYYSRAVRKIDGIAKVTAADIAAEISGLKLTDDDLENCKIWLEVQKKQKHPNTSNTYTIWSYAVGLTEHMHTPGTEWKSDENEHWYECTECGAKCEEDKHDYEGADWLYDDNGHYRKCNICKSDESKSEKVPHELKEDGKCTICPYDINTEHEWVEVPKQDPTCTEVGYERYWHCEDGYDVKYYSPEGGIGILVKFTDMSEIEIKAQGHDTEGEYKYNETEHWRICTRCGEKADTAAHTMSGNKCTTCGYTKSSGGNSGSSSSDDSTRNSEGGSSGSSSGGSGGGGGTGSSAGISIIGTSGASGAWVKDNTGWRYKYTSGTYATGTNTNDADGKAIEKITWIKINNADYAFGSDTYLKTGWVLDNTDGKWYYCDVNKGRLYGWYYDTEDNYWYYLDANTGAMLTGWQLIGGKQYYFAQAPAAATYAFDASSAKWVYSNAANYRPYGSMYANTVTPDNHQVDADGARVG